MISHCPKMFSLHVAIFLYSLSFSYSFSHFLVISFEPFCISNISFMSRLIVLGDYALNIDPGRDSLVILLLMALRRERKISNN